MRFSLRRLFTLVMALSPALQFPASAQEPPTGHSPPPISSLRMLIRNSGYIFDGTVLSVERVGGADPGSLGTVQVTFRVERAIRGVRNQQMLAIHEWAGLWNSGERYHPGERLLLFFYSPGKLGLTSPVAGPLGRFVVDAGGNAVFDNARLAALSSGQTRAVKNSPDQIPSDPTRRAKPAGRSRISTRTLALAIQRMARE